MPLHRRLTVAISKWQTLIGVVFNPYRPELHYMRGPGPKWHAKHRATQAGRLARRA
ncbi:MAG TPA: hypothetical protein VKR55_01560 [Bradyrhizobium sp.]|uniref:hypothetical protein n=1 Tax=Bradyrhizobium sp. TaxID=376 RepID=UPI002C6135B9|nr:hypothetical protein [Bradyrhizobium sp.]HLZ00818.1 hypothetical protein [Bradyrhizobium sp.]